MKNNLKTVLALILILWQFAPAAYCQSFTASDFDTLQKLQTIRSSLTGDAYRYFKRKIPFYGIWGAEPDANGGIADAGNIFHNEETDEWIETRIKLADYKTGYFYWYIEYYLSSKRDMDNMLKGFTSKNKVKKNKFNYIQKENRNSYIVFKWGNEYYRDKERYKVTYIVFRKFKKSVL